ncbi:hypothetical protein ACJMK2_010996 [Sinanodonta woodiana]|uniref:LIM zinc-binding domain-containing protein n=1 Tax=Sinanodonta woodiana TaxID=1069815 RepID=A0ABD3V3J8_SINWO
MYHSKLDDHGSSDGDSDEAGDDYEPRSQPLDPCYRCKNRVYPVERIDLGVLFHRRCFRCRTCGLQLTLRTFQWDQEKEPDVYCRVHAPKLVGSLDQDAVGIKSALNAPKWGTAPNEQIRGSVYNPGWQYDANALEFAHQRGLSNQKKQRTSFGTYKDFEESGIFDAQTELERQQKEEEDLLYKQFLEEREKRIQRLESELQIEKDKSVKELIAGFEHLKNMKDKSSLEKETKKLEMLFRRKKEERLKRLIERLTTEEKDRVTQMIQKHCQEMLDMIADRSTVKEATTESDACDRESETAVSAQTKTPPISPPEFKRCQLFKSPEVFESIDKHVFEVARKDYNKFTALVKDLIVYCQTDLEKARAIFRWITVKDLNQLEVDEGVNPESPLGLLRGIKYGTESYHDLFKRLCSYAGLFCEVIQGYSKGAGYKPGMRIEGNKFRNSWTAVFVDGSWYFANCNWGARHVKGQTASRGQDANKFFYKCDEFYFITDPEDHIYQHYPDDPKWQLLECPITLTEFITLPVVKSPFFNYGLRFAVHYDCIQYTQNGLVVLQLKIPSLLGFGYTFDAKDKSLSSSRLEGRVMLRIVNHNAIFTVAPPKAGRYFFSIYAKDDWASDSLQCACVFRIKCVEKRDAIKSPYPKVPFFGPTPAMSQYELLPETHIDPLIMYSHDDVLCRFKLQKMDIHLFYTFKYHGPWENDISDFQRFIFVKSQERDSITYQIRCPLQGKYVFSILGSKIDSANGNAEENNGNHDCLFRYLLECRQPARDKRPLPRACHRWLNSTLLEPTMGDIPADKSVTFRVRAPQAADVAMLLGDSWFHFKEIADSIWEGTVYTGTSSGKAKLYAKLDKKKSRFSPLLEFQIKLGQGENCSK